MIKTRVFVGVALTATLMFGTIGGLSAQPRQEGLVNVFADDVNVQIPIAIAANICGVAVNLLVQDVQQGPVVCETEGVSIAQNEGGNGQAPRQSGLVNVALVDVNVQVPVSVAANICGVAINVLATNIDQGSVDCEAIADSGAQN
jgi:hypothetical protein